MTREELKNLVIPPINQELYKQVKKKLDQVAKPLDGLGEFEQFIAQIGAIQKNTRIQIDKKAVLVFCADNGIVKEGVSQSDKEVTLAVAKAMGKNQSSVGKMAAAVGAVVIPVDIGIDAEEAIAGVRNRKVTKGTRNFAKEPAMTEAETLQAIEVGIQLVKECKGNGYQLLATGEMGIGNTTTSTAICAALLHREASEITGRGAGLDDVSLNRKVRVIEQAVMDYQLRNADPFTVLRTVGGLDIAGMTGVFFGSSPLSDSGAH